MSEKRLRHSFFQGTLDFVAISTLFLAPIDCGTELLIAAQNVAMQTGPENLQEQANANGGVQANLKM